MEWIFNEQRTTQLPTEKISWNDYMYLWMSSDYEYQLVIEKDKLGIYSYDYWSEETILQYHEWESWWSYLWDYFHWMYDCFTTTTMCHTTLNIEWKNAFDIAKLIVNWADRHMNEDINYYLVENDDRTNKIPSSGLIKFIEKALSKIGEKVYCYYK